MRRLLGTDDMLAEMLRAERLTSVVDIGANPIDGDPPYKAMLRAGLCTLIGFEPQGEALAALSAARGPHEQYLPHAIGAGGSAVLRHCQASGMTSLFEPDRKALDAFTRFAAFGAVTRRETIETTPLDNVVAAGGIDFLKMDIQGGELDALRSGPAALSRTVVIQLEVSFIALYEGQPVFGDVDCFMRQQGFIPHAFAAIKQWPLAQRAESVEIAAPTQLLEADIIYVRDFIHGALDAEQWKQVALIAHYCYGARDLTLKALSELTNLGAVSPADITSYMQSSPVRR